MLVLIRSMLITFCAVVNKYRYELELKPYHRLQMFLRSKKFKSSSELRLSLVCKQSCNAQTLPASYKP